MDSVCPDELIQGVRAIERICALDDEKRTSSWTFEVTLELTPSVTVSALLDSGAGQNVLDTRWAREQRIRWHSLPKPKHLRPAGAGEALEILGISQEVSVRIGAHRSTTRFVIADTNIPVILGLPWLRSSNPSCNWAEGTLTFPKEGVQITTTTNGGWDVNGQMFMLFEDPKTEDLDSAKGFGEALIALENSQGWGLVVLADFEGQLAEFEQLFDPRMANRLPDHTVYDHRIPLMKEKPPPNTKVYPLSWEEDRELREYLDAMLEKGFIRVSESSAASPCFFVKKDETGRRLVVDYRELNKITIKDRTPLPLIAATLDRLRNAKIFTQMDLRGAYNLVRMAEGEEWKTAFRTRYGLFEYCVMPFGLTNAPATFQRMINEVLRDLIDVTVVVYLDDILVFSEDTSRHTEHVREVLDRLEKANLAVKKEKCRWSATEVDFLGYQVTTSEIRMHPNKLEAIQEYRPPRSLKGLQRFLGMANFYRRFISRYSDICRPLHDLTKNVPYEWTDAQQRAFETLKEAFLKVPVLRHFSEGAQIHIEADASNFAMGAVLTQADDEGVFHPVAFCSKSFDAAQRNYDIHDKELLAILIAFREWRPWLAGASNILVHTDHRNLEYFFSKNVFKQRHWRWREELSQFDYVLRYRQGSEQRVADALSRREELEEKFDKLVLSEEPGPLLPTSRWTTRTEQDPIGPRVLALTEASSEIIPEDNGEPVPRYDIMKTLREWSAKPKYYPTGKDIVFREGVATRDGRFLVPPDPRLRYKIVANYHDPPTAGHRGVEKTYALVRERFHWPGLRRTVQEYVGSCSTCVRAKVPTHKPYGYLVPLPVPRRPWDSVSIDFISGLPESGGFGRILTVVDRFTKLVHLLPVPKIMSGEQLWQVFVNGVVKYHGYPSDIVSDRDILFTAGFWHEWTNAVGIRRSMSTAFHPETDGQTERANQVVEQVLRCYVNFAKDNWLYWLTFAEIAINRSEHSSTGVPPYRANYGFDPTFDGFPQPVNQHKDPRVQPWLEHIDKIHEMLRRETEAAQLRFKFWADKRRSASPEFPDHSLVWLRVDHLPSKPGDEKRKLAPRRVGPFRVLKKIGENAYRLELPNDMGLVHPVYNARLLELYTPSPKDARDFIEPVVSRTGLETTAYGMHQIRNLEWRQGTNARADATPMWMYLVQQSTNPEDLYWRDAALVQKLHPTECREFHQKYLKAEWPVELRNIGARFEQGADRPDVVPVHEALRLSGTGLPKSVKRSRFESLE